MNAVTVERLLIPVPGGHLEAFKTGHGLPRLVTGHTYLVVHEVYARSFCLGAVASLLLVNPRGSGASSPIRGPGDVTLRGLIDDLEEARIALGIKSWTFFGTSSAAMAGLIYALERPESLNGVVLNACAATSGFYSDLGSVYSFNSPHAAAAQEARDAVLGPEVSLASEERWAKFTFESAFHNPKYLRHVLALPRPLMVPARLAGTRADLMGNSRPPYDVTHRLPSIRMPVLLTAGKFDLHCPPGYGQEVANNISHSRFVIFEESGHFPFIEEAVRYRKVVREFFSSSGVN